MPIFRVRMVLTSEAGAGADLIATRSVSEGCCVEDLERIPSLTFRVLRSP